ncbi:unnamed protein product [Prorocentrum cordatum]|uniref:Uncharacterized protein n=1 Tax=Prorocentrum cordatum TaxID=2364126 RepID=A0ABN9PCV2_9DINO|nr:unnamed protein product [Polarella glacialis]
MKALDTVFWKGPAQPAFNMERYQYDLTNGTQKHTCASSEWNRNLFFTFHGGVPYNETYIQELKHACFREPGLYVGVVVAAADDPAINPVTNAGNWERLSPEEPFFARLLAIKDAIEHGASEQTLEGYRKDILNTTFQFEVHKAKDDTAWSRSINLREQVMSEATAVGRDTLQRICEALGIAERNATATSTATVMQTRSKLARLGGTGGKEKKISNDTLFEWYKKEIALNSKAEPITKTFIESASSVVDLTIKYEPNLAAIRMATLKWGSSGPFESVYKLSLIVSRCNKDKKMINWVLNGIIDLCESGAMHTGEITLKNLKDGIGGNKGLIDVLAFKKELREFLTHGEFLAVYRSPKLQAFVQEVFSSHRLYRTKVEPLAGDIEVDSNWKVSAVTSEKAMFELTEGLAFGRGYDQQLRYCCRKGKSTEETLEHAGNKEEIDKVWECQTADDAEKAKKDEEIDKVEAEGGPARKRTRLSAGQEGDPALTQTFTASLEDPGNKGAVDAWYLRFAQKKVSDYVKLISDSGKSEAALQASIAQTTLGMEEGDMTGHILVHAGVTLSGEPVTAPHLRAAPFRKDQLGRLFNSVISARRRGGHDSGRLSQGGACMYLDGGKKGAGGVINKIMVTGRGRWKSACQAEGVARNMTHMFLDEDSLKGRRALVRGISSLKQLQTVHFYRAIDTVTPEKKRAVYPGPNNGDTMGPITYESWDDSWKLPFEDKKKFLGPNRKPAGGKTIDTEDASDEGEGSGDEDGVATRNHAQIPKPELNIQIAGGGRGSGGIQKNVCAEPVNWHQLPKEFYQELTTSYYAKVVMDLTPGGGVFSPHCVGKGIGYLGICFQNEEHKQMLMAHLVKEFMVMMKTEGHKHYHANYARFLAGKTNEGDGPNSEEARKIEVEAKKAAAAAKRKSKAEAKKRAHAKTAAESGAGPLAEAFAAEEGDESGSEGADGGADGVDAGASGSAAGALASLLSNVE